MKPTTLYVKSPPGKASGLHFPGYFSHRGEREGIITDYGDPVELDSIAEDIPNAEGENMSKPETPPVRKKNAPTPRVFFTGGIAIGRSVTGHFYRIPDSITTPNPITRPGTEAIAVDDIISNDWNFRKMFRGEPLPGTPTLDVLNFMAEYRKSDITVFSSNPMLEIFESVLCFPKKITGKLTLIKSQKILKQPTVVYVPTASDTEFWEKALYPGRILRKIRTYGNENARITIADLTGATPERPTPAIWSIWSRARNKRFLLGGKPWQKNGESEGLVEIHFPRAYQHYHILARSNAVRIQPDKKPPAAKSSEYVVTGIPIQVKPEIIQTHSTSRSFTWIEIKAGQVKICKELLEPCSFDPKQSLPTKTKKIIAMMIANARSIQTI